MLVPPDEPIVVHAVYMDPPASQEPIQITVSNPGSALISVHPEYPNEPDWALVTPLYGKFVINVTDGVLRAASPEYIVTADSPPVGEVKILLG